jgi:dCMP deaminase
MFEGYIHMAKVHAERHSDDPDTRVAAVVVDASSGNVLSAGVNGMPAGVGAHAERWVRPEKYKWVVHAELAAVANAARRGVSLDGSTCVVTMFPCVGCSKALVQAGVRTLVAPMPDHSHPTFGAEFQTSMQILREANVTVHHYP